MGPAHRHLVDFHRSADLGRGVTKFITPVRQTDRYKYCFTVAESLEYLTIFFSLLAPSTILRMFSF